MDNVSAYDDAQLNFTLNTIQNIRRGLSTIKSIGLYDSSQLSIDSAIRAIYDEERLTFNNLTANGNSIFYLKNSLIASDIILNNNVVLSMEPEAQVLFVTINNNSAMTMINGVQSNYAIVNDNGSIIIDGNNAY